MSAEVVKFPGNNDDSKDSLDKYLENITREITDKKITSLLSIVYIEGEDEPSFYLAGEYRNIREILGDMRLMEEVIINDF